MITQYLVGSKVKLIKFSDRHITNQYLGWLNDHEVNRYLNTGRFPVSRQDIVFTHSQYNMIFAVMSNIGVDIGRQLWQDTEFKYYIGTCSLHDVDWISRKGEIGYMVGEKDYWGAGITTEIVGLLADYSFNRLNLNKITAGVVEGNIGSVKVLERNGFKQFAVLEQEYFLEGKYLNVHRFHNFQGWCKNDK